MCVPQWKAGIIGTAFFIGWASTLLWLPRLGDKYGRQKVFAAGMTLNLLMYALMMWTHDLDVMIASSFFQGALTSVRINVGFLYMLEMMPAHLQTVAGSLNGVFDACTYLAATIYFWQVSKDWFYFALVGFSFNVISAVGAWFLPESPRYLCEKQEIYELERSLKAIAKVNGRQLCFNPEQFKQSSDPATVDNPRPSKTGARFYLR